MTFQAVIKYLIADGWTQKELAEEAGCSQSNIARLLRYPESEPKWSVGDILMDLYYQAGGK